MEDMEMINPRFWRGRRIFVTGHTGFKGSWLSQWLTVMGAEVRGYSLEPPTDPSLFTTLDLEHQLDSQIGDIRDIERLKASVAEHRPEIVFHLAAQPLVRLSYKEPRLTYETNVMGTLNLYEAVRACDSVRVVVSITTDKCYENKEWVWGYREIDPLGGYDPYSSSKACAEILTAAYRNSYFNPDQYGKAHQVLIATARAGNVIGGGDWALDRLIPDCVRALSRNETILIRNPKAIRPWQHVLEPLCGYILLAQRMGEGGPHFGSAWNFGPSEDGVLDVENVVRHVIKAWGSGDYTILPKENVHEAQLLKLDSSKAHALLGWRNRLYVPSAIEMSVKWYKAFLENTDMKRFTENQIKLFSDIGRDS